MASSSNSVNYLNFRSSDSDIFELEEGIAVRCLTIKNMVEDGCADGVIPLSNVDSWTLAMVIKYCKKHADKNVEEEELKNWKKKFFEKLNVKHDLYNLLNAANYLQEEDLLASCCQRVADLIKGKSPEQIRIIFGIKNDFTPEEQQEMERAHAWAFR